MTTTTQSKDGTRIAFERVGNGPAVVLVDGAFCRREMGPMRPLAKALASDFTVFLYDRRGRGESGDTQPYAIEREIEDLAAVAEQAGGNPHVYGTSSGAALALRAVGSGSVQAKRLAIFEPPFALDGTRIPEPPDYREQLVSMIAAGQRDAAVKLFLKVVGVPSFGIVMMRIIPGVWSKLRATAHTLPYDLTLLGDTQRGGPLPADLSSLLAAIAAPTAALVGGKSPAYMHHAVRVVSQTVPGAAFQVVPGVEHNASARAMAPVLRGFFTG